MTFVVPDTSTWARQGQPLVAKLLSDAIERNDVVLVPPVRLELVRSTRGPREAFDEARRYDALRQTELTPEIGRRAADVQLALARRGHHRGVSATDLLIAACAESADAEIWHCDRDFEFIAEITGQRQRRVGE